MLWGSVKFIEEIAKMVDAAITMSNDHSDRLCFFVVELCDPNYAANQHKLHPDAPV